MADTALSGLTVATTPLDGTEGLYVVQGGNSRQANVSDVWITPINAQVGTTYTFALTDGGHLVTLTNGSAITATIPANADVAFQVGTTINVAQLGAGTVTIQGDTGVTVNGSSGGSENLDGQYAGGSLIKLATNTWLIVGKLA